MPKLNRDLGFMRFYDSVNVLMPLRTPGHMSEEECALVFLLLQMNIHLNLRTDTDFFIFFDSCASLLIRDVYSAEFVFKQC